MKPEWIVSACLCGIPCRYDGGSKKIETICRWVEEGRALPVCPEQLGGLSTPRIPCEIRGEQVVDKEGNDRTAAFALGAQRTWEICRSHGITKGVLKQRSPSCGSCQIYDGSFSGVVIPGQGITARLLLEKGVTLWDETQMEEITEK